MKPLYRRLLFVWAALVLAIPVPAQQLRTVVIDPGHGGKDPGCVSRDKKTYEKDIVLDIGKRLAQKISTAYPDVTVQMTRTDDVFVELENRAVFANKAGANLFISLHVNSVEKGTTANGYSVHVLGQSQRKGNDLYSKNLDLVKRENSVILLEDNYQTKYQGFNPNDPQSSIIFSLMQNAHLNASLGFAEDVANAMGKAPIKGSRGISQDPFWVLWRTAMPSVLIEVGFITNPDDLATLRSESGRDAIAQNILTAFRQFKTRYDGSVAAEKPAEKPAAAVQAQPEDDGVRYGVQVLVSSRQMDPADPFFQGYQPLMLPVGKLYKYIIGCSAQLKDVKANYPKIQQKFPDSYLVRIVDGIASPVK